MWAVLKMQCFSLLIITLHVTISEAVTWQWDDTVPVLYPSLPIAAPLSENESCRNDSRILLRALNNFTLWAVQMLDSSAQQPGGILFGNVYQLGNFDECLDVTGPVQSQYCLTEVRASVSTDTHIDPYIQKYDPESSVWDRIKNTGNPIRVTRGTVYQAVCVPASCSHQDIETAVSQYLQKYQHPAGVQYTVSVAPDLCHTSQPKKFSYEDYIFICVMAVAVTLVIAGTALDYVYSGSSPGALASELLLCFSARRNLRQLDQKLSHQIDILRSMKFMFACLIILDHTGGLFGAAPLWNLAQLESEYQTVQLAVLHRGEMIVDNFFVISGLLVAYVRLHVIPKKGLDLLHSSVSKIARVLPASLVIIFFYATLFYKLGSGPRWDEVVRPERDYCQKNWWTNLLFINNYVNSHHICLLQSYFLACDMHFFIAAIPVVMLLSKRPRTGVVVLVGILLASILIPFLVTYLEHKPALLTFYVDFLVTPRASDTFQTVYIKSHTRASPYFVGIAVGYLLYRLRDCKQRVGVVPSVMLCCTALVVLFGIVMSGLAFHDPTRPYSPLEAGIFAGTYRFVWSLAISVIIVIIMHGKLPVINSVLSNRILLGLGNLTYCMFLVHPVFQYWYLGSLRRPEYFNYKNIVLVAVGLIVLSTFASLFLYLTVEEPCRRVVGRMLSKVNRSWTASIFRVNPEDGGSVFLHNVCAYVPCYTASCPRRP